MFKKAFKTWFEYNMAFKICVYVVQFTKGYSVIKKLSYVGIKVFWYTKKVSRSLLCII